MQPDAAIAALGALAHEHRLACHRMLTFHLQQLLRAGLATQRRASRQVIYAADFAAMNALVAYLTENCCGRGCASSPSCDPVPCDPVRAPEIPNRRLKA
jgi:hypothetical protein